MDTTCISGAALRDMLISAAGALEAHKQEINELNVFPVPDGDTGTNMSMTMNAAVRELNKLSDTAAVSEVADVAASFLLRGARGNSGVILSLLFRGIARSLGGKATARGDDLAQALQSGVDAAYKAVMKPSEGTILTVAREAAAAADIEARVNPQDFGAALAAASDAAVKSLAKTPELLPILKKAGVVDAGGKGFTVVLDAMRKTLAGENVPASGEAPAVSGPAAVAEDDEEIHFTYCTEFIINRDQKSDKDPLALRAFLEAIGDCVLVADDHDIIKVHCHTDNPGNAIQEALTFGFLTDIKIDNMRLQHQKLQDNAAAPEAAARVEPKNRYGFVAVAAGKGLSQLFGELGADRVVDGGQTMNPSTEDILANIEATPAENVIVLPNNKNIILAAEQAVALADRSVYVLHTKSVPQGISALLSFDAEAEVTANLRAMEAAADRVKTGLVTFAARDSDIDGNRIAKDEIIALTGGKLVFSDSDPVKAAQRLVTKLADKGTAFISILYGEGVTAEQAEEVRAFAADKFQQAEINVIDGGQPIYHFILSFE